MDKANFRSTADKATVTVSAPDMVDALNNTFGRHAGKRASHAKGFCASGEFLPDPAASGFAASDLFAMASVPAVVRFSVGGGNPAVSDKSRSLRGLAIHLAAPTESWDMVLGSEPVFFAADPASFVSFLNARIADPVTKKPDPAKIASHNLAHPDGILQPALLAAHAAPSSYASTPYFSNNAFVFHGAAARRQVARLILRPLSRTLYLSAADEADFPDDFLEAEMTARLARAPVEFEILAQLPAESDALLDPSKPWVGTGMVALGLLRIRSIEPEASCNARVFSPLTLPAAITPTDDPILAARAPAYAVSKARRNAVA